MFKKSLVVVGFFSCLAGFFYSDLAAQYRAEDITVPPGYKVVKVAETNRVYDPYRLAFDSSGNLFVASYGFVIYEIDATGKVQVVGKTRKHNISPLEIEVSPAGTYVLRGIVINGSQAVYVFQPPDTYMKVIENPNISAIGYDKLGNFYAALQGDPIPGTTPVSYYSNIVRYDANFNAVEITFTRQGGIRDFAFDSENNLYVLFGGFVIKLWQGGDGIPGPGDSRTVHATGLYNAGNMAIDSNGNLYLDEFLRTEINGFSTYTVKRLTRVDPAGNVTRDLGPEFFNSQGLACRDNYLYASEDDRGVISRVDLTSFQKTDFTEDTGIDAAGALAWDAYDNLFTSSFRQLRMMKQNTAGKFDQFGPGTGYMQSIAYDGSDFYIGSAPTTSDPLQILKIDPATGSQTPVAKNVAGWRTVAFDSYGRLILNRIINEWQNQFGADIIDTTTGTASRYLVGLHNKGRCIQFDGRQNIYFVEGNGDGIKKIKLEPSYSPARDVGQEPVFYDFITPGFASPTIYFFAVNPLEEVFVPRMDSGDVLFCDPSGNITSFAQGFILPTQAAINRFGALYIADASNGIFRIVHERWIIPIAIELKDKLLEEVRNSSIEKGIKTSLIKKLENADKDLEKGGVTLAPAIGKIGAFVNEVQAQSGKKIPADLAARWIEAARDVIKALRELV